MCARHPTEQDAGRRVMLVEAGPDHPDVRTLPCDIIDASEPTVGHDWGYSADAELDRGIPLPRARIMGGCSATNACFAMRARQPHHSARHHGGAHRVLGDTRDRDPSPRRNPRRSGPCGARGRNVRQPDDPCPLGHRSSRRTPGARHRARRRSTRGRIESRRPPVGCHRLRLDRLRGRAAFKPW